MDFASVVTIVLLVMAMAPRYWCGGGKFGLQVSLFIKVK